MPKQQTSLLIFFKKSSHRFKLRPQKSLNLTRGAVAQPNPDHLWRLALQHAAFREIRILRRDGKPMSLGIAPNLPIISSSQTKRMNMLRPG